MARGFLTRVWSPLNRGLQAVGEVGKEATSLVGNVFGRTVTGVRRVGRTVTGRLNQGVSELVGKSRKGGARKTRRKGKKSRKASRKNRH
jgi:hypothetical protein